MNQCFITSNNICKLYLIEFGKHWRQMFSSLYSYICTCFGNLSIFKVSIWQKKIFRTFKIRFKMKWTCDMPTALAISRNVYLQSLSIISLCLRLLHSLLHVQVGNIFFGLLQTEISFSLYKDTLLEPWISQFSKKVFFWMVEFCAKLKNPISLIFLTRFTTNSGQRLAILTSLVFVIHIRSAVAFSTLNTQLLYVCFKLWYFRCVSVKSSSKLILFKRFLTIACMI